MELANAGRILNCDVTGQDILNAEDIFGPEVGSLKGKTVRTASEVVRSGGLVPIPATILEHYQRITPVTYPHLTPPTHYNCETQTYDIS